MAQIALILRILIAVLVAVAGRTVRRIFRGPVVPTWSWSVEMTVVAMRALVMASAKGGDRTNRRFLEAGFNPSLPVSLRGVIDVRSGSLGGVPGEWHVRQGPLDDLYTILYLHGGAYLSGNPATHRRFVARLTWETHTRAFVPDYRLAPAHPFPAALDDALSVYLGLLEEGIEPGRIVLAGDSAGGGLAAALLLRLRDEDKPLPSGSILFSPYTDLEHRGESVARNWQTDYLPLGERVPNHEYIGTADPRNPYISPIYGEYTGIPPMLVFAGGKEMILDDSIGLVESVKRGGGDVELLIEPDMFHVWPALIPNHAATARTMAKSAEFLMNRTTSGL